jgi:hypothetical protein
MAISYRASLSTGKSVVAIVRVLSHMHYHDGVYVCGCIQPFPRSALPLGEYKDARGRFGSVLA